MFTGIVKFLGEIVNVFFPENHYTIKELEYGEYKFDVKVPSTIVETATNGDSIAVNGVCLTIISINKSSNVLSFQLGMETLNRTTFISLKKGDIVNIEPSLKVVDFIGGHVVQGHVDTTAKITKLDHTYANSTILSVEIVGLDKEKVMRCMSMKGYACIDGISLTIINANFSNLQLSFNIINATWENTTIKYKKVGDLCNIEADSFTKAVNCYLDAMLLDENSPLSIHINKTIDDKLKKRSG